MNKVIISSRSIVKIAAAAVLILAWNVAAPSQKKKVGDLVPAIAFVSTRDHGAESTAELFLATEIYLIDMDGKNPRRLTNNRFSDLYPNISPDGRRIVFESGRLRSPGDPDNLTDLFIMNSDGSSQRHLIRGSSATWSPDGKHIAYHASASGRGTINRTNPGAATSDSDIFILNVDDFLSGKGKLRNLTNDPAMIDEDPDWSPDGKTIAFTRYGINVPHDKATSAEIFLINANGIEKSVRLTQNNFEERGPAWSPDRKQLASTCRINGSELQACVMNADGTAMRALTTISSRSAAWSPDGKRIIFHRTVKFGDTEDEQLFSIDLSAANEIQLTSGTYLNGWANPGLVRRTRP